MKFLIQTISGKIRHDFTFTLIKAIEYQNWTKNSMDFELAEKSEYIIDGFIPIGSVEFVLKYLFKYNYKIPQPKNVPEKLFPFAKRNIFNGCELDINPEKHFFKSNDKIKGFSTNKYVLLNSKDKEIPIGGYQISDFIEIESEWRAFIYQKKLVGLQNYLGDFTLFPDVNKINEMINTYDDAPIAYTLDVGINKNKETFVIEVHDFFSCGLYGFEDLKILPFMFSRWFYEFTKK